MTKYEMKEINSYPDHTNHQKDYEWLFFYCEEEDDAEDILSEIVTILEPIYQVEETGNYVLIYSENKPLFMIESFDDVLIMFSTKKESINFIHDAYMTDGRLVNQAYIQTEFDKIQRQELSIEYSTGLINQIQDYRELEEILPNTIFRLYLGKEEIGKAILSYINWEMSEINPTLDYIEILKNKRRKGYGTYFLKQIEKHLERSNFDLIWISNVQEYDFFRKNGYQFDLDEGYKYLEYDYDDE